MFVLGGLVFEGGDAHSLSLSPSYPSRQAAVAHATGDARIVDRVFARDRVVRSCCGLVWFGTREIGGLGFGDSGERTLTLAEFRSTEP